MVCGPGHRPESNLPVSLGELQLHSTLEFRCYKRYMQIAKDRYSQLP